MFLPAAIKSPRFLRLELLQFLSGVCSWLQTVLLGILVFNVTGRPMDFSLALILGTLPQAVLSPLGGRIADRFPRRRVLLWTQGLMMIQSVLMATLTETEWRLYVLIFAASILRAVNTPAYGAYLREMIGAYDEVTQGNAWYVDSLLSLLAFSLGYFGASVFNDLRIYHGAFLANGLSFIPLWFLFLFSKTGRTRPVATQSPRLWDAVKYLATTGAASRVLLLYTTITVCVGSINATLLIMATDILGKRSYISLSLAYTVGGLVASLGLVFFQKRIEWVTSWSLYGLLSTLYGVFGAIHSLPGEIIAVAGVSFMSEAIGARTRAMLMKSTPEALAGRVGGLFQLCAVGGTGVSSLLAGTLIQAVGVLTATIGSGLGSVIAVITLRAIFAPRGKESPSSTE